MTRAAPWLGLTMLTLPIALLMAIYVGEFGWAFASSVASAAVAVVAWVEIARCLLRA